MPRGSHRIRDIRNSHGLSQLELAARADLSPRTVQFAESGTKQVKRSVLEAIATALNVQYEDVIDESDDAFLEWPWELSKFIRTRCLPDHSAYCQSEADAATAIRRMRDSWQTHLETTGSESVDSTFGRADQMLDQEYDAYDARYRAIWKKNPRTIFFGMCAGQRSCIMIVLPVTDSAFERLREGRCSFMDISDADILPESQNIILDSAVEFADIPQRRWYQVTNALSFAFFHQISSLGQTPSAPSFRILSFGASPTNIKRLAKIGLVPNGVEMPKFNYPICQLTGDNSDLSIDQYNRQVTWANFSTLWHRMVNGDASLKMRRRLFLTALASYKSLLDRYEPERFAA